MTERDDKGRFVEGEAQDTNKNGKAGRPTVMTKEVLEKLETAFKKSYTDKEACLDAGIDPSTLYRYIDRNPEFGERKEMWKKHPNLKAKEVWLEKIEEGNFKAAKEWLERKSSDEFSTKQELDQNVKEKVKVQLPDKYKDSDDKEKQDE